MAMYISLIQFTDQGIRNVKSQTLRAFRKQEMEGILAKLK